MSYSVPFACEELSYEGALELLHNTLRLGISPMLETVEDMLAELGDPDQCFTSLQIAGTNGKTSTARYTAALLGAAGYRTALYTSPELVSYTERMEIEGVPVSEAQFAHGITCAHEAGRRVNERRAQAGERPYDITEFDLITVAACVVYAEAGVELAVLECGMGGRWDATSAIKSIVAVAVTGVGLDHIQVLGDTVEAIASEKAAIIKTGRPCVLGVGTATPARVEEVFLDRCKEQGVDPVLLRPQDPEDAVGEMLPGNMTPRPEYVQASYHITHHPSHLGDKLVLDVVTPRGSYKGIAALKPSYQAANIACALALSEEFLASEANWRKSSLNQKELIRAILSCPTPGRFDAVRTHPLGLIDACHNPQSVETFLSAMHAIEKDPAKRPTLLCAALADKDCKTMVELLSCEFDHVVVTQTSSARALPAEELAQLFNQAGTTPEAVFPSVKEALAALASTDFIACGSITLAGEVAGLLRS